MYRVTVLEKVEGGGSTKIIVWSQTLERTTRGYGVSTIRSLVLATLKKKKLKMLILSGMIISMLLKLRNQFSLK